MEMEGSKTESVFEKMVLQRLIDAGYRVQTQWPVGARRIDLVVEGHSKRLAVECDGEKWHTPENLNQDLERQAILERLGWTFVRVRGSVFFRDPDAALAPVFAKIAQLGIEPLGSSQTSAAESQATVLDRIRRQAALLRTQWRNEKKISLDEV
jgi:very-short-patch-repair endonuclease